MESYSRIRSVKLKRPTPEHPFGLSVRGGHEHGTGIFVSSVTPRSIAHRQGLKVGDQILRVNGYPVSSAVHHECLSLMKVRTSLHLKVRSVGMIPVRERNGDPLTWKLIEEVPDHREINSSSSHAPLVSRMSDTSSQPDSRIEFHGTEAKVYINTSRQSGLGCCICKGPPERPGIFVQSTKSNGVAREAGLRPGDQILHCNGHSFLNIPFAEAVYHLKSSKQLNLAVIKGAAADLFPGESSGYNSSASSLNGETHVSIDSEHSTPTSEIVVEQHEHPKRLSMVTEEQAITLEDRGLIRRKGNSTMALDRNMAWDEVEQVWHSAEKESIIIEVKGEESTNSKRLRNEEARLSEERKKIEEEHKRLAEEANRLEEEKRKFEEEKRRTMAMSMNGSITSRSSSASSESANGLAGALTQEILKRNERREQQESLMDDERQPSERNSDSKKPLFTAPIDDEKRQQHEQLIEEFKRAHRKMFSPTDGTQLDMSKAVLHQNEERESFRAKRIQKEVEHARKMVEQRVAGIVRQRQLRIERQHQESQETEREVTKRVTLPPTPKHNKPPPPPPPLPAGVDGESTHDFIRQNLSEPNTSTNGNPIESRSTRVTTKVLIESKDQSRPESPSPDYSNSPSPTPDPERKSDQEKVVQVTAYPSIYSRPAPSRLDFLNEKKDPGLMLSTEDVIRRRELENAFSRCYVSGDNLNEDIKRNSNGVTIILNGTHMVANGQNKSLGGILKNSTSNPNGQDGGGNLKSISFGKF